MTSYTFKNMLIMERASTHGVCGLMRNKYNIWFDDNSAGFQHENPQDKIIVFYNVNVPGISTITKIPPGWMPPQCPILGSMKILSNNNGTKFKVINCTFPYVKVLKWELLTFKKYLVENMRLTKNTQFVLYWERFGPLILNNATNLGLLTDYTTMSHTFTISHTPPPSVTKSMHQKGPPHLIYHGIPADPSTAPIHQGVIKSSLSTPTLTPNIDVVKPSTSIPYIPNLGVIKPPPRTPSSPPNLEVVQSTPKSSFYQCVIVEGQSLRKFCVENPSSLF